MPKIIKITALILITFFFAFSCRRGKEESFLSADFEILVNGKAPTAEIEIINNSAGVNSYEWTFSEGVKEKKGSVRTPKNFIIDKAGKFTVTLKVSNGKYEKIKTKTVIIPGNSPVFKFKDIKFSLNPGAVNSGRCFSSQSGIIYKDDEISETNSSNIDLVLTYSGNEKFLFVSPDDSLQNFTFVSENHTLIENISTKIAISDYEKITDDYLLKNLIIDTIPKNFDISGNANVSIFETSGNKKAVVFSKNVENGNLITDIIVQKYSNSK